MANKDVGPSFFHAGTDSLGAYATANVDTEVYGETVLLKTAYWFTDQYYLFSRRIKTIILSMLNFA